MCKDTKMIPKFFRFHILLISFLCICFSSCKSSELTIEQRKTRRAKNKILRKERKEKRKFNRQKKKAYRAYWKRQSKQVKKSIKRNKKRLRKKHRN